MPGLSCSCTEREEARARHAAAGVAVPFAWACAVHDPEPVFYPGGRNSIECECGWRRRVPMRGGGTPFREAYFFHAYETSGAPGHSTTNPADDGADPVDILPGELEVGGAWWAGYLDGWAGASERLVEAARKVAERR